MTGVQTCALPICDVQGESRTELEMKVCISRIYMKKHNAELPSSTKEGTSAAVSVQEISMYMRYLTRKPRLMNARAQAIAFPVAE